MPRTPFLRRAACWILKFLRATVFFLLGTWCALVALYAPVLSAELKAPVAALAATVTLLLIYRPGRFALHAIVVLGGIVYLWTGLAPSNDRDWPAEISRVPRAEINGDEVTIHNVRDFRYRSVSDFDERWVTKKVNLSELSSLDLYASYWGDPKIAHIFVTFGFADREYISISVETRRSKDEIVGSAESLFRNYEIVYVVAEERDLVGVRTNHREPSEDVYLYRLAFFKPNAIKLFKNYIASMNALVDRPKFYNMLVTNCTTQVFANTESSGVSRFKYNWRILFSGYTPDYTYLMGNMGKDHPFEDLKRLGRVNERAHGAEDDALGFSRKIREGVPQPPQFTKDPGASDTP